MLTLCVFALGVGLITAVAALFDLRLQRIPNYVTVPAALAGLAFHLVRDGLAADGQGWWHGLWFPLAGFGIGFALLFVPWLLGGGGMGDVKLLGALGAWLGPVYILPAFGLSAGFAMLIAIGVLAWSGMTAGVSATKGKYLQIQGSDDEPERKKARVLPFAVPVALGTWLVLAWMVLMGKV
jgi:prepilin peptidase CpaA